jgi:hypothetical protein
VKQKANGRRIERSRDYIMGNKAAEHLDQHDKLYPTTDTLYKSRMPHNECIKPPCSRIYPDPHTQESIHPQSIPIYSHPTKQTKDFLEISKQCLNCARYLHCLRMW